MNGRFSFAVLTVSDRCYRGLAEDTAGPALRRLLEHELGAVAKATACVPDEAAEIARQLTEWAGDDGAPELVVTTGGTGLGPRDVTPEATRQVMEREHSGLMELVRVRGAESTPLAYLSRGVAGTIRDTLVINLPGSERGAVESLEALVDVLPHAIDMLRGEGHGRDYDQTPLDESE